MDETYQKRKQKLISFYKINNYVPSYGELTKLFNLKSKGSMHRYVNNFIRDGLMKKSEQGRLVAAQKLLGLPILGSIQAGIPTEAEEEVEEVITLDEYLFSNLQTSYLVRVVGDSMQEAGILEGDIVVVDTNIKPRNNDVVIAQVDNEWTMKYFIRQGKKTILRAGNKKYKDIFPKQELKITGVVMSVVRKYH